MRFVDTNVFIYHLAQDPAHSPTSTQIVRRIKAGEAAVTSTFVVSESCAFLARAQAGGDLQPLMGLLSDLTATGNLNVVETTLDDFSSAALAAPIRLWGDFVIRKQMQRLGLKEIYSADQDFDRMPGIVRVFS